MIHAITMRKVFGKSDDSSSLSVTIMSQSKFTINFDKEGSDYLIAALSRIHWKKIGLLSFLLYRVIG